MRKQWTNEYIEAYDLDMRAADKCEFVGGDGVQCNNWPRLGSRLCPVHDPDDPPQGGKKLDTADKIRLAHTTSQVITLIWDLVKSGLMNQARAQRLIDQLWTASGYGVIRLASNNESARRHSPQVVLERDASSERSYGSKPKKRRVAKKRTTKTKKRKATRRNVAKRKPR